MKRSPACKLHRSACYFAAMEPSNGKRPLPGFLEISEAPAENRTKGMLRGLLSPFRRPWRESWRCCAA